MKRVMIVLAIAGLMAGCARNRQTGQGQGGAGYNDTTGSSSMGTNSSSPSGVSPSQGGTGTQGGTQGGTGAGTQGTGSGTQGGTTPPAPGGAP